MFVKEIIHSDNAPKAIGPYSQAVRANGFVFVSGQIAINPKEQKIIATNIEEETKQVLDNISAILNAAGLSLDNVVKTTCLLKNIADFKTVNQIYASYFQKDCPARAAYQVADLPAGANIEIEVIAAE